MFRLEDQMFLQTAGLATQAALGLYTRRVEPPPPAPPPSGKSAGKKNAPESAERETKADNAEREGGDNGKNQI